MKINYIATRPHHRRHVEAVWRHLPEELRGRRVMGEGPRSNDVIMVGGYHDLRRVRSHRVIYVEHGAGQTYAGEGLDPALLACYGGGPHPGNVAGYISPSQRVADLWDRPAFAAGCPALDEPYRRRSLRRMAVITFHFDANIVPEARSARPHYVDHLSMMVRYLTNHGLSVFGHYHPRDGLAKMIWRNLGVPVIDDPDEALARAQLVLVDNSSFAYEAAALDIPVILMNAPWYRRDVEHGLRFWSHVPGVMIDDPYDLCSINLSTYCSVDPSREARRSAAAYAYAHKPDGHRGAAAARWIAELVG